MRQPPGAANTASLACRLGGSRSRTAGPALVDLAPGVDACTRRVPERRRRGFKRAPIFERRQTEAELEGLTDCDEALAHVEATGPRLTDGNEQAHGRKPADGRGARRAREQLLCDAQPPILWPDEQMKK